MRQCCNRLADDGDQAMLATKALAVNHLKVTVEENWTKGGGFILLKVSGFCPTLRS